MATFNFTQLSAAPPKNIPSSSQIEKRGGFSSTTVQAMLKKGDLRYKKWDEVLDAVKKGLQTTAKGWTDIMLSLRYLPTEDAPEELKRWALALQANMPTVDLKQPKKDVQKAELEQAMSVICEYSDVYPSPNFPVLLVTSAEAGGVIQWTVVRESKAKTVLRERRAESVYTPSTGGVDKGFMADVVRIALQVERDKIDCAPYPKEWFLDAVADLPHWVYSGGPWSSYIKRIAVSVTKVREVGNAALQRYVSEYPKYKPFGPPQTVDEMARRTFLLGGKLFAVRDEGGRFLKEGNQLKNLREATARVLTELRSWMWDFDRASTVVNEIRTEYLATVVSAPNNWDSHICDYYVTTDESLPPVQATWRQIWDYVQKKQVFERALKALAKENAFIPPAYVVAKNKVEAVHDTKLEEGVRPYYVGGVLMHLCTTLNKMVFQLLRDFMHGPLAYKSGLLYGGWMRLLKQLATEAKAHPSGVSFRLGGDDTIICAWDREKDEYHFYGLDASRADYSHFEGMQELERILLFDVMKQVLKSTTVVNVVEMWRRAMHEAIKVIGHRAVRLEGSLWTGGPNVGECQGAAFAGVLSLARAAGFMENFKKKDLAHQAMGRLIEYGALCFIRWETETPVVFLGTGIATSGIKVGDVQLVPYLLRPVKMLCIGYLTKGVMKDKTKIDAKVNGEDIKLSRLFSAELYASVNPTLWHLYNQRVKRLVDKGASVFAPAVDEELDAFAGYTTEGLNSAARSWDRRDALSVILGVPKEEFPSEDVEEEGENAGVEVFLEEVDTGEVETEEEKALRMKFSAHQVKPIKKMVKKKRELPVKDEERSSSSVSESTTPISTVLPPIVLSVEVEEKLVSGEKVKKEKLASWEDDSSRSEKGKRHRQKLKEKEKGSEKQKLGEVVTQQVERREAKAARKRYRIKEAKRSGE